MKPDEGFDNVFWPTALALLTQARPMEAASLLASHPKANSELYRDVRQLLITMPVGDPQQLSAEGKLLYNVMELKLIVPCRFVYTISALIWEN